METAIPIETEIGILSGRDCIFFDAMTRDSCKMIFTGEINSKLASKQTQGEEYIPYKLTFKDVLVSFSCELDTYCYLDNLHSSSFDLIDDSDWLKELPIRYDYNKEDYNHYCFHTYDDVFNIIASGYQLELFEQE